MSSEQSVGSIIFVGVIILDLLASICINLTTTIKLIQFQNKPGSGDLFDSAQIASYVKSGMIISAIVLALLSQAKFKIPRTTISVGGENWEGVCWGFVIVAILVYYIMSIVAIWKDWIPDPSTLPADLKKEGELICNLLKASFWLDIGLIILFVLMCCLVYLFSKH